MFVFCGLTYNILFRLTFFLSSYALFLLKIDKFIATSTSSTEDPQNAVIGHDRELYLEISS